MKRYPLIILLLLLLSNCASGSAPFSDDFSDPASGWGASSHETYVRGYQQGQYLIQIDVPHWFVWATIDHKYRDAAVEVTTRTEETPDNHYGILCRYENENFYYFAISSDGYYAIYRHEPGQELIPLTGTAMLRSSQIHTDGTENHLRAECQGNQLTFYVNGTLIAQVEDDTLTKGAVGLAAGTLKKGGTLVWFDDFNAQKP